MIFTHRIKNWMKRSHIKLWYLTDAEKKIQKEKERNNNATWATLSTREHFLQKYTREHDKHESTSKLNCVGDGSEKPSARIFYFFFFFFSEIAEPRKVRVWFLVLGGKVSVVALAFRIASFFRSFSSGRALV